VIKLTYANYLKEIEAVGEIGFFLQLGLSLAAGIILGLLSYLLFSLLFQLSLFQIEGELGIMFSAMVFVVSSVIVFALVTSHYDTQIGDINERYKQNAPKEWVVKEEQRLCSINVENQTNVNAEGFFLVSDLSTENSIDYKYLVKDDQGYQFKLLSQQYPRIKQSEIYVKEEPGEPKVVYEQQEYKEKEFNKLFFDKNFFIDLKKRRLTFTVPKGTVLSGFEQGSIK
jgi:hypothetical protein